MKAHTANAGSICHQAIAEPNRLPATSDQHLLLNLLLSRERKDPNMNGQEAFRRLAQQLQRAGGNSGGRIPGGKGAFAGGGLLVALIGGGLALNASLFNGAY